MNHHQIPAPVPSDGAPYVAASSSASVCQSSQEMADPHKSATKMRSMVLPCR